MKDKLQEKWHFLNGMLIIGDPQKNQPRFFMNGSGEMI